MSEALISCVLPLDGPSRGVALAIEYFQRQDYPNTELLLLHAGETSVDALPALPGNARLIHVTGQDPWDTGRLEARGEIVVHWSASDWHSPDRVRRAIRALGDGFDIAGHAFLICFHRYSGLASRIRFPGLAPNSLAYRRRSCYDRTVEIAAPPTVIGILDHPPEPQGEPVPCAEVRRLLGTDWSFYERRIPVRPAAPQPTATPPAPARLPLASCLVILRHAERFSIVLDCFDQQTYPERELIVIDASPEGLRPPLPSPHLRYYRASVAVSPEDALALARLVARGEFLIHWGDDDWHSPLRIRRQLDHLAAQNVPAGFLAPLRFYDPLQDRVWESGAADPSSTLCYRRGAHTAAPSSLADPGLVCRRINPGALHNLSSAEWRLADAESPPFLRGQPFTSAPSPLPRVSCLMPTSSRRRFARQAIDCFLRQTYEQRELWIVDDGTDPIADIVPSDPRVHYLRLNEKHSPAEKISLARQRATGHLHLCWADDAWHAPHRIRALVEASNGEGHSCSASDVFHDLRSGATWTALYPPSGPAALYARALTSSSSHGVPPDHPIAPARAAQSPLSVYFIDDRNAAYLPDSALPREELPVESLAASLGPSWRSLLDSLQPPVVQSDRVRPALHGARTRYHAHAVSLADYRGIHAGETIIVCGCGQSLSSFQHPERFLTIGVNDVGRLFDPDYLIVVNPRNQFAGDRFRYVEESRARAIFTQLPLALDHPRVVHFQLGRRAGTDFSRPDVLHYTNNSPYVAVHLAVHMGARRIGLIGVDFTDHHFFGPTGRHSLQSHLPQIDSEYALLFEACREAGIELINLSPSSRLNSIPRLPIQHFDRSSAPAPAEPRSLSIVSYSTTPLVGVPLILSDAINARTHHSSRTVWAARGYGNGMEFDPAVEWPRAPQEAESLLRQAGLVFVHNGKVDARHRPFLAGKPVVTVAHNYLANVDPGFFHLGHPGLVIGQYQATLPEFKGWHPVPNPIPLWSPAFAPARKPERITICYTPANRHEVYPLSHRLHWHSKGYSETMRILRKLEQTRGVRLEVLPADQVSHSVSLDMKRRSHIVIDECITGSYHRNSLEGLALGAVVVNAISPVVESAFRHCAEDSTVPFVRASLDELESVLQRLIERGPNALEAEGRRNRLWMETNWDFSRQWRRFWEPAIQLALHRADRERASIAGPYIPKLPPVYHPNHEPILHDLKTGVSAVVCHGGHSRLHLLAASLVNLRQCEGIDEIIVVDMGDRPWAEPLARQWADKYVFLRHHGLFERARALNTGTAVSEYDLVLWKDNDLLVPPGFVATAIEEARSRQLDFLVPWSAIHYISEADTIQVLQGTRNPADCTPLRRIDARGGAGLVRRAFVLAFGGLIEEFRGWGGEDNSWWHKANLLGNASVTRHRDQTLYHLYHYDSGSNHGANPYVLNPGYAGNFELMRTVGAIHRADEFLKRFPSDPLLARAWSGRLLLVLAAPETHWPAAAVCLHLRQLFDIEALHRTIPPDDPDWIASVCAATPDAIVIACPELAERWFTEPETEALRPSTLIDFNRPANRATSLETALALLPRLSLLFERESPSNAPSAPAPPPAPSTVWLYWEGDCPEWIRLCRLSVEAHASDVRVLAPSDFDALRDIDRDIDLSHLQPAHRADYIRAFLLYRYGGLWIDADCLVLQSLQTVLELLQKVGFVAYRERSGYVANNFIASGPGGPIISTFYQRVRDTLRSGCQLGWISIGAEPLTEILSYPGAAWHELACAQIQPICWSDPGAYFQTGSDVEHGRRFDPAALSYMLSNTEVRRYQASHPGADLLAPETFFRYLIARALHHPPPKEPPALASLPAAPFVFDAASGIRPERILDIAPNPGRWGVLLHELLQSPLTVEAVPYSGDTGSIPALTQPWDLVLITDLVQNWGTEAALARLAQILDSAAYVLLMEPVSASGALLLEALTEADLVRFHHDTTTRYGSYLLSGRDPNNLKTSTPSSIWPPHIQAWSAGESRSGPGSSLECTVELRQRLPQLYHSLGVRSILDAPCGDFHWMRRMSLPGIHYIGVDIVPAIVEQNRARFSRADRDFLLLDLTRSVPPRADLIQCRDCLVHLSHTDIFRVLRNFARTGSRYLLTTTFEHHAANSDIQTGDWRQINLCRPPFSFPAPLRLANEKSPEQGGRFGDKCLGLWRIEDLRRILF